MEEQQYTLKMFEILEEAEAHHAFYDLADLYRDANDRQRNEIRDNWDFGREWHIPDLGNLACPIPNEPSSQRRIWAALVFQSLNPFGNPGELNINYCLIYHSALAAGLDAEALFKTVIDLSEFAGSLSMQAFLARPPEKKALKAFGLRKEQNDLGPVFRRTTEAQ